jgi:cytochrome P450
VLRRLVGDWLVFLDPPRHTRLRALVTRHFTARVVAGLRPRVDELAGELLAGLRGRPSADLVAEFAAPLPVLVIGELLGVPPERRQWVRDCALALQQANTSRRGDPGRRYAMAEAAAAELSAYFHGEVRRRRQRPRGDVMTALAGGELSADEIVATCVHLLTAGHETTTNLIAKATLALLRHPAVRDELRAGPALTDGAVDELIRFDPPVQMVSRWTYRDLTVSGRTVPRGSRVVAVLGSANRDPRRFADPDTLDIHRDPGRHAGFGMGIHFCLGAGLARLEAGIALSHLLRGLPGLALGDEPPRYADDLVFHGPERLVLRTAA